jgi:hypothetical protein
LTTEKADEKHEKVLELSVELEIPPDCVGVPVVLSHQAADLRKASQPGQFEISVCQPIYRVGDE